MSKNQPPPCPKCGSIKVVPIIYGEPSYETYLESKKGKLHLGGCCITGNDPEWYCNDCEHKWGKVKFDFGD